MIATPRAPITNPIALMTDRYGSNLAQLPYRQKLFVVSVLSEWLRLNCPLEDVLDSLDPDAIIPNYLCDALRKLESSPRRKLIDLLLYCSMALLVEA